MPVLLLILCLLLSGCHTISAYPVGQPDLVTKSSLTEVRVSVNWVKSVDQLNSLCRVPDKIVYGCAFSYENYCKIHVIEPRDFDDIALLAMLGHEFWHCLGARHKLR